MQTLNDFLCWAESEFESAGLYFGHGTDNAWDEAVELARHVLALGDSQDRSLLTRPLSDSEYAQLVTLAKKRIETHMPLPYLTHEVWFAGLKFYVDERVIIPRSPLAELILNQFQPWLGNISPQQILDLCTGSGCLAIACAKQFPKAQVDAVDISPSALAVAQKNTALHDCQSRVSCIESDLFSQVSKRYDIILSNPPYVSIEEWEALPKEYHYEPDRAFTADEQGLHFVNQILREAPNYLNDQGLLIVELGNGIELFETIHHSLPYTWVDFERGGQGVFIMQWEGNQWRSF